MVGSKSKIAVALAFVLLLAFVFPVFAVDYKPGVSAGQYVRYGNFVGVNIPNYNTTAFNWMKIEVTAVTGNEVTLQTTGQLMSGSPTVDNGNIYYHNVETGATNDTHSDIQVIMAANLNQGDIIPLANKTLTVTRTEMRVYGNSTTRVVNVLVDEISLGKSQKGNDQIIRMTWIYDKVSGLLLESAYDRITVNEDARMFHWSVVDTSIFNIQSPPATGALGVPVEYVYAAVTVVVVAVATTSSTVVLRKRKRPEGETEILENKVMELTYNLSGVNRGESYLSSSLPQCLKIVCDLHSRGVNSLCIVREDPETIVNNCGLKPEEVILLSSKPIKGFKAVDSLQEIAIIIMKFLKANGGVVLLDGLSYLISRFTFNSVYMCLQEKKIEFMEAGGVLLVPVNMETLDNREKGLLLSELKLL
jgi:hypothetical protein